MGIEIINDKEYELLEMMRNIKDGEIYIPIKEHKLLKRIYKEQGFVIYEFYPNVPHIGLGLEMDMKFKLEV